MGSWAVDLVIIGDFVLYSLTDYVLSFQLFQYYWMNSPLAGLVCWNISICAEAVANNYT